MPIFPALQNSPADMVLPFVEWRMGWQCSTLCPCVRPNLGKRDRERADQISLNFPAV